MLGSECGKRFSPSFWIWLSGLLCAFLPKITWVANSIQFENSKYSELTLVQILERLLFKWDAPHYLQIALRGYDGSLWQYAFFPLYPKTLSVLAMTLGIERPEALLWAASGFNLICLFFALYYWSRCLPNLSHWVRFVAFFPTSVFFATAYPEILFIALGGFAFHAALQEKALLLMISLPLFMLTKHAGVAMAFAVPLWALLFKKRFFAPAVAAWLIGLVCVLGFYYSQTGDALIWLKAQSQWGRSLSGPWNLVADIHGKGVEIGFYVLFLFIAPLLLFMRVLKASGKQRLASSLAFLWVSALYVPLWFGSSTASIYRIVVLGTPALCLADGIFRSPATPWKKMFWIFLFVLNVHATYRFVAYLQLA